MIDTLSEVMLHDRSTGQIKKIGGGSACFVIAEAGVNHNGSLDRALRLVDIAADAGADAVKFQTFDANRLARADAPLAEYQQRTTDFADQRAMLAQLALTADDHRALVNRCKARGIIFLSSPFDERSMDFLVELGVCALKIASGEITNWPLLVHAAQAGLPLLVSTGMSTAEEVNQAVLLLRDHGVQDIVLFHCVSAYPALPEDTNLRAMATLAQDTGCPTGLSDHSTGTTIAIAAVALGAAIVEKHFTEDRSLPGPDHAASLEPEELRAMIGAIRDVEAAMGTGVKAPRPIETDTARVARRSLVAVRPLPAGHRLCAGDLIAMRPAAGISPMRLPFLMGRRLRHDVGAGDVLREVDLEENAE